MQSHHTCAYVHVHCVYRFPNQQSLPVLYMYFVIQSLQIQEEDATCIYLASQNGHMEVVTALLEAGADVNSQLKVCWQLKILLV